MTSKLFFLFLHLIGSIFCVDYQPPLHTIRQIENKLQIIQSLPQLQLEQVKDSLDFPGIISNASISEPCEQSLTELLAAIQKTEEIWALQMVDADGTVGSGFFQGNTLWLGRYSECQDPLVKSKANGTSFYVVDFGVAVNLTGVPATGLVGKQGVCLPESCTAEDVTTLANETIFQIEAVLSKFNINVLHLYYSNVEDVSKDKNLFGEISSVWRFCALVTLIILIFAATVLDILGFAESAETKSDIQIEISDPLISNHNVVQAMDGRGITILQLTRDKKESESDSLEEITTKNTNPTPFVEEIEKGMQILDTVEVENNKKNNDCEASNLSAEISEGLDDNKTEEIKNKENDLMSEKENLENTTNEEEDDEFTETKGITVQIETHEEDMENTITEPNKTEESTGLVEENADKQDDVKNEIQKFESDKIEKKDEDTIQTNEGSIMKVLSDSGYKTLAENTLAEMGIDFMDGNDLDTSNDVKHKKKNENQIEDRAKSLEVKQAKEKFSEEPSLRSFRKIASRSRDFNNILKKFKSFENVEDHTPIAEQGSSKDLKLRKQANLSHQQAEKIQDDLNKTPLDIVEIAEKDEVRDEIDGIIQEDTSDNNPEEFNKSDIGEDEIDGVIDTDFVDIKCEYDNLNVGEDEIDGIFPEDITDGEATILNLEIEDLQDDIPSSEGKRSIEIVEEYIMQVSDDNVVEEERKILSHDEIPAKKSGWPSRLGGMVEIFANEENLEKCIEKKSLEETSELEIIKNSKTKGLNLEKCIKAFSAIRNLKKICSIADSNEELSCLHGIRFLSMTWVILGHTFYFSMPYLDNPAWALDNIQNSKSMEAIEQGTFSVDSFFFLSGLLVSYIFLTKKKKIKSLNVIFWVKFIFHRFVRLLPPYLTLILLVEPLTYYACEGPLCKAENDSNCYTHWWTNLLNINNFWKETDMCAPWTWYLANDFQFFCISPIFLIPLVYMQPVAWVLLLCTAVGSWISIVYKIDHRAPGSTDFDVLYDKPWIRISPYLIGLGAGCLVYQWKTKYSNLKKSARTWMIASVGWILAIALSISVVYGVYHADLHLTGALGKLNTSLSRSAWTMGVAWMTLACIAGYGGPINWVLSLPPLRPLSRLTYAAYLIHPLIILFNYRNLEVAIHASIATISWFYVANLGIAYGAALVYSLIFEAPYMNLQKLLGM